MNTCQTCKHWSGDEHWGSSTELGTIKECVFVPMFYDSTEWGDEKNYEGRRWKPEFANRKAFVQDASDYQATLYTRADFACNQWEPAS